ncbi:MAG: hypothetical protein GY822_07415 [Deltaproteobacteria bacterium]|nr:hypothetical protein [Deltaproteobacteria bacterium]
MKYAAHIAVAITGLVVSGLVMFSVTMAIYTTTGYDFPNFLLFLYLFAVVACMFGGMLWYMLSKAIAFYKREVKS